MRIEFLTRREGKLMEYEYKDRIVIKINGKKEFDVQDDEPEDSNLSRSFSDCYKIVKLMRRAYDAGKNGEDFEIESIESNNI